MLSKTKECLECSSIFTFKDARQKFCSHSCAATLNNRRYPKRASSQPKNLLCLRCAKVLGKSQAVYCSQQCFMSNLYDMYIQQWIRGDIAGEDKNGSLSKTVRRYLLNSVGEKCSQCGWNTPNPVVGHPILTINHIDGNWKNNRPENLEVLCYNCHTLTETFGALNSNGAGTRGSGNRIYKHITS